MKAYWVDYIDRIDKTQKTAFKYAANKEEAEEITIRLMGITREDIKKTEE